MFKDRKISPQIATVIWVGFIVCVIGYTTQPEAVNNLLHYHGSDIVPAKPFQNSGAQCLPDHAGLCNVYRIELTTEQEDDLIDEKTCNWSEYDSPAEFMQENWPIISDITNVLNNAERVRAYLIMKHSQINAHIIQLQSKHRISIIFHQAK